MKDQTLFELKVDDRALLCLIPSKDKWPDIIHHFAEHEVLECIHAMETTVKFMYLQMPE